MRRLQEVSQSWSDSPYIADNVDKLSPECRDLLDRIFTVDAQKRITVEEIMVRCCGSSTGPAVNAGLHIFTPTSGGLSIHMAQVDCRQPDHGC